MDKALRCESTNKKFIVTNMIYVAEKQNEERMFDMHLK